jgi:thioredoxin-like negative regulator of GroEL
MNRGIPFTVLPLLLVASTFAAPPTSRPATPVPRSAVRALAPAELDAALKAGKWLIVEFGGEHCIPCMQMQPILQDLQVALAGKAMVHNFWIQQQPETARRFTIMVMPTQVVFNPKGEEVLRHMGYFPPAEFHRALREKGLL